MRLPRTLRVPAALGAGLAALAVVAGGGAALGPAVPAPPVRGFTLLESDPGGGTIWQGVIRNTVVPGARRPSLVYLPPGYTRLHRYPVVYLLHGLPGSPYSYSGGMRFAQTADALIADGFVRPFLAVMPVAGRRHYDGEWAGPWERFVMRDVLPWTERHFSTERGRGGRTIAGLSAGGFGAVDIGLRHPLVFSTLEAWSGYFAPPRDGPLRRASRAVLAEHDPSVLVRREGRLLRRDRTRIYLSVGTTHDRWTERVTLAFAAELRTLRVAHRLFLAPGGHDGRFWRRQLPAALAYAVPGPSRL